MTPPPDSVVEWIRLLVALTGISGFGLLVYRLIGRHDRMSWLSKIVTGLLALSVLAFGLGAARAEQLDNKFNELILLGLFINVGSTIAAMFWHRWTSRDPNKT